jgi:hypothetical protein
MSDKEIASKIVDNFKAKLAEEWGDLVDGYIYPDLIEGIESFIERAKVHFIPENSKFTLIQELKDIFYECTVMHVADKHSDEMNVLLSDIYSHGEIVGDNFNVLYNEAMAEMLKEFYPSKKVAE